MKCNQSVKFVNPHEEALQTHCKKSLKSKIFKGFYQERRYVDYILEYRDLITLESNEKELKSSLEDTCNRLSYFYRGKNSNIWIGITTLDSVPGAPSEVCIWSELGELAFGQYWFSVKTLKFREKEVIVKLKTIRPVEPTEITRVKNLTIPETFPSPDITSVPTNTTVPGVQKTDDGAIGLNQFLELFSSWGTSINETTYNFMSNGITKNNIFSSIKFILLLILSMLTGAAYATKMLGFFTLRLMAEISKFTRAATPIILAIIDMCSKIVGGFFILLAMIWRDTIGVIGGKSNQRPLPLRYQNQMQSLEYKRYSCTDQETKRQYTPESN